jgi:phosphatidylglycerol:prolipoprotein diacylglycerol transferase
MLASIPFPDISPVLLALNIPQWQFNLGNANFSLGGFELAVRWYALAYIAGILLASWMMRLAIRRTGIWPKGKPAFTEKNLDDLITWLIIGIIIGGRLGYVLFYKPLYYLQDPIAALRIFDGGMSFHGGFLGVILAGILFCRKHQISILPAADVMAMHQLGCCLAVWLISLMLSFGAERPFYLGGSYSQDMTHKPAQTRSWVSVPDIHRSFMRLWAKD